MLNTFVFLYLFENHKQTDGSDLLSGGVNQCKDNSCTCVRETGGQRNWSIFIRPSWFWNGSDGCSFPSSRQDASRIGWVEEQEEDFYLSRLQEV